MLSQVMGLAAATLTTCAFMPQACKVFKTGNTSHLSLWMLLLQGTGNFFWCIYGYLIHSDAVLYANVITVMVVFYILVQKVWHMLER